MTAFSLLSNCLSTNWKISICWNIKEVLILKVDYSQPPTISQKEQCFHHEGLFSSNSDIQMQLNLTNPQKSALHIILQPCFSLNLQSNPFPNFPFEEPLYCFVCLIFLHKSPWTSQRFPVPVCKQRILFVCFLTVQRICDFLFHDQILPVYYMILGSYWSEDHTKTSTNVLYGLSIWF